MVDAPFTIEFFEEADGRSPVEDWMDSKLSDTELAALLSALEHVLAERGVNVCATEWGKQMGDGLFEFRVRHTAGEIERMFGSTAVESGPRVGRGQVCSECSVTPMATGSSFCSAATTKGRIPAISVRSGRYGGRGSD